MASDPRAAAGGAAYRRTASVLALRVLLFVVVVVALGAAALLVVAAIGSQVGTSGLLTGGLLALLPVVPVTLSFLWLDRWEPEPLRYLLLAFGWGASVAAAVALVVNTAAARALEALLGAAAALDVTAVVVAPVVEESAKAAFVVGFVLLHRGEFDGVVDGIVLAGLVAVGFAFAENVLYFGRAFADGVDDAGLAGGIAASGAVFVVRGVLSPFAHPLFTVAAGIGLGLAVTTRSRARSGLVAALGLAVAVGLHATWNAAAVAGGEAFLSLYAVVMVPVFLVAVALAVWSRRREGTVVRRHLPAYAAAGWLAPHEVAVLCSLPLRRRLVREARARGGKAGERATRDYHAAATELAFLRARMLHGTAGPGADRREQRLLAVLADRRGRALRPAPPLPHA